MKKNLIIFCFLLNTITALAQQRVATHDIYVKDGLAYSEKDNSVFTGIAEFRRSNGHLVLEEIYNNGYKTRYKLYYNTDEVIVSNETLFQSNSHFKKTDINYSLSNSGTRYIHYDAEGRKVLEEIYQGDKLVYSCEFRNNKKHGKKFCITKKGDNLTEFYENGKKIKTY